MQIEYSIPYIEIVIAQLKSATKKIMGREKVSKYILIAALTTSAIISCPMGLGKNYENKPAFFHADFYAYKNESAIPSIETVNAVAQKNSTVDQRRSS